MTPRFSIVTPVYDPPADVLRETIASVTAQTFDAIRVLELATIDGLFETRGHVMVERGKVADAARLRGGAPDDLIDVLDYIFDCAREHVSFFCGSAVR